MPKPMTEDLPFPDLSVLTVDGPNARIIMPAYADCKSEMTAVLQYIYQSIRFDVFDNSRYATTLEEIAIAEMKHLDLLGEALLRMGVDPLYVRRPPERRDFYSSCCIDYSTQPSAMLAADITAEKEAIVGYESMLGKLTNPTVAALVSRILLDERLHLEKFKEMYRETVGGAD